MLDKIIIKGARAVSYTHQMCIRDSNNLSSKTVDIQNLIKTNLEQKLDLRCV